MITLHNMPDLCKFADQEVCPLEFCYPERVQGEYAYYTCTEGHSWSCWWKRLQKPVRRKIVPQSVKIAVTLRDGGRCVRCGSEYSLEYDHIFPWSKGGNSTVDNIQLLCRNCNLHKANLT